jgi:hypothetical protein
VLDARLVVARPVYITVPSIVSEKWLYTSRDVLMLCSLSHVHILTFCFLRDASNPGCVDHAAFMVRREGSPAQCGCREQPQV